MLSLAESTMMVLQTLDQKNFKGDKLIDLNKYKEFVEGVTSDDSNDWAHLQARLHELNDDVNIALLLTGAIGIASMKEANLLRLLKSVFSGKSMDDDTQAYNENLAILFGIGLIMQGVGFRSQRSNPKRT